MFRLKKFLTKSLIGRLHIKEYHNGIPIAKPSQTNINEGTNIYYLVIIYV